MTHQNSIVVYRSRSEQAADEFWQDHPEAFLISLGFVVLVVAFFFFKNKMWRN